MKIPQLKKEIEDLEQLLAFKKEKLEKETIRVGDVFARNEGLYKGDKILVCKNCSENTYFAVLISGIDIGCVWSPPTKTSKKSLVFKKRKALQNAKKHIYCSSWRIRRKRGQISLFQNS